MGNEALGNGTSAVGRSDKTSRRSANCLVPIAPLPPALPRVGHVLLDDLGIAIVEDAGAARFLDELGRALDHAVTLARLARLDFAGRGHLEALFSARFGFHFWHFAMVPKYEATVRSERISALVKRVARSSRARSKVTEKPTSTRVFARGDIFSAVGLAVRDLKPRCAEPKFDWRASRRCVPRSVSGPYEMRVPALSFFMFQSFRRPG